MNYRQLEEGINKWTLELEEQEKVFLNQATQVNAWDRLLMENGEKIVKLHESVEKVKHDQQVRIFFKKTNIMLGTFKLTFKSFHFNFHFFSDWNMSWISSKVSSLS